MCLSAYSHVIDLLLPSVSTEYSLSICLDARLPPVNIGSFGPSNTGIRARETRLRSVIHVIEL